MIRRVLALIGFGGTQMSSYEFAIAYDGPALQDHTMDVQTLGPALLAIGDMCREAHRVVNGQEASEVSVRVKATAAGCFDILFELSQIYNTVSTLVKHDDIASAKEVVEWIGLGTVPTGSLLAFLKWKSGRRIIKQEPTNDVDGKPVYNITVEGEGNSVTIISEPVYRLSQDARLRAAQRRTLSPLSNAGVDEFQVRQGRRPVISIGKDEVASGNFDLIADEIVGDQAIGDPQVIEAVLLLRSPVFVKGTKWQFYYGEQRISAALSDPEFVKRVFVAGERFGVGHRFRVRLCLSQSLLPNGTIRNAYEILKVIETTQGPRQLDFSSLEGEESE